MTCKHCLDANIHFDHKTAVKQMKVYQRKGPTGTTKEIVKMLERIDLKGKRMLDIGGGIGVLQWYFLKNGGLSTVMVDASAGYLIEARSYAAKNGFIDKTQFIEGDFNDHAGVLEKANVVSLDKVVCCYPDYERILNNSIDKVEEYLAMSFPISNWISIAVNQMNRLFLNFRKSEFRSYIHPVSKMRELVTSRNMVLEASSRSFPWLIELYRKA